MLDHAVSGKSYSVEVNERLRERARALLMERYGGVKAALATALGLSQATVSNFLNGKTGAGQQLVSSLARELGTTHVIVERARVRHNEADVWAVQCELVLPHEVAIRCSNVEHAMQLQPNASRELLQAIILRADARALGSGWAL